MVSAREPLSQEQLGALATSRLAAVNHLRSMRRARDLFPCEETGLLVVAAELVIHGYNALLRDEVDHAAYLAQRAGAIEQKLIARREACPGRVQYQAEAAEAASWN